MSSGLTVGVVVLLVVVGGSAGIVLDSPVAQQGGGGPGGGDGGDGQRTPGGGDGSGPGPNVSVDHRGPGNASITVRNAGTNRTVQVRFRRTVESPETGLRLREMTVTAGDPEYRVAVHTRARASAGAERFPGAPPFGYLNVTHTVPNANVTNATFTFTLNRTRLRERTVAAENVGLYRYRTENRTWQALQTRVRAQNRTHVTYRAVSPGLSEFAVAPTAAATTSTPTTTATATATPTPEPTVRPSTPTPTATPMPGTDGSAPGFGPLAALLALAGFGVLARRR
ncbi:PGF-pre-PGF domain-containing protein [Haloplanus rubicundus]|uniref:PGF-pre-PGF domain-containing protein n=1 Tax=Haloplanus rubicundus TaxID=1547898 RepID=A0A345E043_9EURY|nr:PGF-pre-PGF domain-containing protein [Haloplanus rubicundus]AXG05565.1 PGF-pre-PGF domain-containing protein [Haloplanus rubicundus]